VYHRDSPGDLIHTGGLAMRERAERALEDPQAQLERAFIEEYLQQRGCSLATLSSKPPAERQELMIHATQYADMRLAEIDARAAYVQQIHGGSERD
jgi:hypothetical protein